MEPLSQDPTDNFTDANRPLYEVKANLFKGLAHPVRVRVLEVLANSDSDLSVSDLLTDTGLEASHLSQHLSVLRRHNLVVAERRGSLVFYSLAYPQVADLLAVARQLLVEILETTQQRLINTVGLPRLGSTDAASPGAAPANAAPANAAPTIAVPSDAVSR